MEALREAFAAAGGWLDVHKFQILAAIFAIAAAFVTAHVMRRLDEGRVRGLGIWFSGLLVLFLLTIASVRADVANRPDEASAPYQVAFLVLFGAALIWWYFEQRTRRLALLHMVAEGGSPSAWPRAFHASPSLLVLIACGALLAVLWIIAASIEINEGAASALRRLASLPVSSAEFLAQAAAAGLLAMATIQGVRTIVPVRGAFHRASLIRWIDESVKSEQASVQKAAEVEVAAATDTADTDTDGTDAAVPAATDEDEPDEGEGEEDEDSTEEAEEPADVLARIAALASPASGTHHYALFDLPIEQLCGQIAAGADRLLDGVVPLPPRRATVTLGVAIATDAAARADAAEAEAAARKSASETASTLAVLSASRKDIDTFLGLAETRPEPAPSTATAPPTKDGRDRMRLRAAISQRIQQNIDRLQIDTTFWWKRLLRGLAVTICGVLGLTLLNGSWSAVVFAIVGGFVAAVSRDLVAIIEKVRR
jgi:hypothetical protein